MRYPIFSNRLFIVFIVLLWLAGYGNVTADTCDTLCINEFMASNSSSSADPQGEYEDWIEIYNKGEIAVNLMGMYLSDDLADPSKWQLPDITLEPGAFMIVWADEDIEDEGLHADFKLSASGESVGLFNTDQTILDTLTFEAQSENISFGRYPDGSDNWQFFTSSSPGKSNTENPDELPGDIDGSGTLGLADAVTALKIFVGIPAAIALRDVNGDGRIGPEEVIYILRKLSESSETSEPRPEGWTEETHGDNAAPDYDALFSDDKVRTIELVVDPADWQSMLDDMSDNYGEFGSGANNPQQGPGVTACVGKTEGDACEMTLQGQTVSGICAPGDQTLICRQNNPPANPCAGKSEGDACEIMVQGQMTAGSCTMGGQTLICKVENQPAGPADVCVGKNEGDACEMITGGQTVSGSCIRDQEKLVCRTDNPVGGDPVDPSGGTNPIWKPCTLKFEDKVWHHVGIRFKGNSSLNNTWRSGLWKLPMRLEFDQFEDDYPEIENQRFYGFKKLSLSSNCMDNSFIREKVAADIFREAGVPAARTAFYRVYVDYGAGSEYFGLYTMVEIPDDPLLEKYFQNSDGNLYKPEGKGATFASFDEASFDKETNEDAADWSDVKALYDALHSSRSNVATWKAGLEKTLNVEGFLRWLAVNTLIQNWDTYGRMSHNYYLYNNSAASLLEWIPWDNNEALKEVNGNNKALSLSLAEVTESWPLIRYLADDPSYRAKYVSYIKETSEGAFKPEKMKAIYKAAHDLIRPYTVGDYGEQQGYTLLKDASDFDTALDELNAHVDRRYNDALQFLSQNP